MSEASREKPATPPARRGTLRALLGTLVFVAFVGPGPVVGLLPWLITRWRMRAPIGGWEGTRWIGAALLVAGLAGLAASMGRFVVDGRGTPAPVAPTDSLVVSGPFRFVRNPMYVSVLSMIAGQGLLLGSRAVLAYAAAVALAFHASVVLYEEPLLARTYGERFREYCRNVRRWVPRGKGWRG